MLEAGIPQKNKQPQFWCTTLKIFVRYGLKKLPPENKHGKTTEKLIQTNLWFPHMVDFLGSNPLKTNFSGQWANKKQQTRQIGIVHK